MPPVAAFVAMGFEHSIANMFLFSFALLTKFGGPGSFWGAIGRTPTAFPHLTMLATLTNLFWVALGNMIGGMLVGITYWFIYLRGPLGSAPRNRDETVFADTSMIDAIFTANLLTKVCTSEGVHMCRH